MEEVLEMIIKKEIDEKEKNLIIKEEKVVVKITIFNLC
jgi:hypothetical protein